MVSIIVPAWNEAKGIANTIKSILEIDYPKDKLEVIVVDDGSNDDTYKIAKQYESSRVRVFKLDRNSGKFAALNMGISKSKGEIIVTTDADNLYVQKDALKHMVAYFQDPEIMCVAPIIAIHNPKGILQRVQQIEYLLGVFLRKAFASMNAVHITPGAFSAYRKSFFEKYGGFRRGHLTEDMEMALRIQYNNFRIENSTKAVVYTTAPRKFNALLKQRNRWYTGLIRNLLDYRKVFSLKYGMMGFFVLPVAISTVLLSILLTSYVVVNSLLEFKKELILLQSVHFDIFSTHINKFFIERYLFLMFSDPFVLFFIGFIMILVGYMLYAKTKVKKHSKIKLSIIYFIFLYSFLFAFWWIISAFYAVFNRKVNWR